MPINLIATRRYETLYGSSPLANYIEGYYNKRRMHSALRHLTPEQAEQRMTG